MISAHPQSSWPWQRMAPRHRPLMTLAFILISMSGLLAGLVLRPLTQSLLPGANQGHSARSAPVVVVPTATITAAIPAANFYIGLKVAPNSVQAGGSFTATATAKLSSTGGPAQGVTATLMLTGGNGTAIPINAAAMTTGADGQATWTITVPTSLSTGTYTVTVTAKWGSFGATWESDISVEGDS